MHLLHIRLLARREKKKRHAAEEQLQAATAKAASDAGRWQEEVELKQARIDMLVAGDRAREADFMAQHVKELQVTLFSLRLFQLRLPYPWDPPPPSFLPLFFASPSFAPPPAHCPPLSRPLQPSPRPYPAQPLSLPQEP